MSHCLLSKYCFLLIQLTPWLKPRISALLAYVTALPKHLTSHRHQKVNNSVVQVVTIQAKE